MRKLASFLAKGIPAGMVLPILRGPLIGMKWIVGAAAGEGKGLSVILNLSEPEKLNIASKIMNQNGICFDVGANVGLLTALFAKYSKQVFAFEPLPRNLRYLHQMLELNNIANVTVIPCAVSSSMNLLLFQPGENCAEGKIDNEGQQPVVSLSLDEFVKTYNIIPTLLKIDVEGVEIDVLSGAKNLIKNHKPIILIETHGEKNEFDCLEFLKSMNYSQIILICEAGGARDFAIIP